MMYFDQDYMYITYIGKFFPIAISIIQCPNLSRFVADVIPNQSRVSEKDLEKAIQDASANFIYDLEKKLDTYVGSSTVLNLSGGQK